MSDLPADAYFSKEHEWTRVTGGVARIGITQHAADQLGDITMVELPEEGDDLTANEEFGSIESVKAVAEIYSPVAGEVTAVNEALQDEPERVNADVYGGGWLIELRYSDESELEKLMDAEGYEKLIAGG